MTREMIQLRPEVEELVREIATRRDSVLLRVPRGRALRDLREDQAHALEHSSLLNQAERHLVQVHREEVAYALRLAAWMQIASQRREEVLVVRHQSPGIDIPVPSERSVAARASISLSELHVVPEREAIAVLLQRCVAAEPGERPSAERLCAAAHRLVPTFNGRMLAATAFFVRGSHAAAQTGFADALQVAPTSQARGIAWNNLAEVADARDAWAQARAATERALVEHPTLFAAYVGCLWFSIRLGDSRRARSVERALDSVLGGEPAAVEEQVLRIRSVAPRMKRGLNSAAIRSLQHVREGAGPSAERILHALD